MPELSIRKIIEKTLSGEIRIPSFQRGFVWEPEKVAFFIDSLYKGYPIGSLLFWRTNIRLENERQLGNYSLPEPTKGFINNWLRNIRNLSRGCHFEEYIGTPHQKSIGAASDLIQYLCKYSYVQPITCCVLPRKIHILRLPGTPDGLKDRPLFTEQGRGDDAVRIYETRKDILILGGYRRIDTIAQQSSRLDAANGHPQGKVAVRNTLHARKNLIHHSFIEENLKKIPGMDGQGWSKLYSGSAVSESPPGASRFYVIKGTGCEAEMRLGREVFRKGRFEDGRRLLHVAVCSVCWNILVKDHGTFFSVLPHRERSKGEASAPSW